MNNIEAKSLSPIENELLFRKWNEKNGIELYLLDGDDTIWDIQGIFRKFLSESYGYLSQEVPLLSPKEWEAKIIEINNELFEKVGVNPNRWNLVMDRLSAEQNLPPNVSGKALDILKKIYLTPPDFLEGSEEGLEFLRKTQTPFGIVTHANNAWTWEKYQWLGLSRYLSWDNIFIVDENRHKTAESWKEAFAYFHVPAEKVAVVGDSPRSDINPAREAGARHCFLINNAKRWTIHNQPVDAEVITINSLKDFIGLGQEYLFGRKAEVTEPR